MKMQYFKLYSRIVYLINNRFLHYSIKVKSPRIQCITNENECIDAVKKNGFFHNNNNVHLSKSKTIFTVPISREFSISCSLCVKGKNRGGKKKIVNIVVDFRELNLYLDADKLVSQFKRAIDNMKEEIIKNLTLRSSTGSIEQLKVPFENKEYFLQELAQIVRRPNTVILNADNFPQAIPCILNAISKSGMNLNPQQDGTKIAIPIPKVTREHREFLAKNAKTVFIKCRDNLKNIQNRQLKILRENSEVNDDEFYRLKAQIEKLCNEHVEEAEKILNMKQAELLGS